MTITNFNPAGPDEKIVHGACRPGRHEANPEAHVSEWIEAMQANGIERVCCLLGDEVDEYYQGLIAEYAQAFGAGNVCHAPVPDFEVVSESTFLNDILPFLKEADQIGEPVVVHCSAGMGRTGQVLVLWLAAGRGYPLEEAIQTVRQMGRSPLEAATREDLQRLLDLVIS
jgi:protein-tyrosine phosphatase